MKSIGKRKSYTPEQVVQIYKKHGSIITVEKARLILEFLKGLARLTVEQIMKQE